MHAAEITLDYMAENNGFRLRTVHAVALVAAIALIIGVIYMATSSSAAQVVAAGDNISVYYTGTFQNGTVFDSNVGKQPLNFTVGSGQLIKGFDQGVVGMKLNETKIITLPPAEAYGEVNQSLIVTVPKSQFGNNSNVSVGMTVTTQQGAQGRVTAINGSNVIVDFNSPMAGKTLVFQIKVVAIKK